MDLTLRDATPADAGGIWAIFRAVVEGGNAFPFPDDITREDALAYWFAPRTHVRVAEVGGRVVGSYSVRPNQPGRAAHVANGAYLVEPAARGLGAGRALGEDSIRECRRLGYRGMQFNLVVATNEPAVRLWTAIGFRVVGTIPGAFRHAALGYVDAHIMFRSLLDG
ncbi:MAG TPA: GNAT family N-acetyltransferase [Urbifossiella sp.]|jgi:L-amino acid N-acyltransferase YncA|nr:GNAT family N-acetyltransferase [Urbifossiella sp.]